MGSNRSRRRGSRARARRFSRWAVPFLVGLTVLGLVYRGSSEAFGDLPTAAAPGSELTVTVAPGQPGAALPRRGQTLSPGAGGTRCFTVTYHGDLPVVLRMYGTHRAATQQLDRSLRLSIVAGSTGALGCPSPPRGQRVFDGTLDQFPTSPSAGGWSRHLDAEDGDSVVFAVTARLDRGAAESLQGGAAGLEFAWNVQQTA